MWSPDCITCFSKLKYQCQRILSYLFKLFTNHCEGFVDAIGGPCDGHNTLGTWWVRDIDFSTTLETRKKLTLIFLQNRLKWNMYKMYTIINKGNNNCFQLNNSLSCWQVWMLCRVDPLSCCTVSTKSADLMLINHQTFNIRGNLVGNEIVDHSDVVGASPIDVVPTTSAFSTLLTPGNCETRWET